MPYFVQIGKYLAFAIFLLSISFMLKARNRNRGQAKKSSYSDKQDLKCNLKSKKDFESKEGYIDFEENDWSYEEAFSFAQRGIPYGSPCADYVAVSTMPPSSKEFILGLQELYKEVNHLNDKVPLKHETSMILATSLEYWSVVAPIVKRTQTKSQKPANWHQNFYKDDIQLFFQVKKPCTGPCDLTEKVVAFLTKWNLMEKTTVTEGASKEYLGVSNALMGGRFDDGIEVPKDPYTFFLQALIGYEDHEHLGGSFLVAQKIAFDWENLHKDDNKLEYIMGRDYIENGSDIFSQKWSPNSHVKNSRVKDENGNSILMARQSKTYFEEGLNMHWSDKIVPNKGTFFIGYVNSAEKAAKIVKQQVGQGCPHFTDHFLNYLTPLIGGLLYIPNIQDLGILDVKIVEGENGPKKVFSNEWSRYHQVDWLRDFKNNQDVSPSPYMFLGRPHFMQVMSTYDQESNETKDLIPPSHRIMRLLSKTFNIWQDTWYFNRKQQDMGHLSTYLTSLANKDEMGQFLAEIGDVSDIEKIPISIRSGLSMYIALGQVLTTEEYGCRGPNSKGLMGANSYHLEYEDLLAGSAGNSSFAQGKYLVDYLTANERENDWFNFNTLTNHSGVGHVVPNYEEVFEIGLQGLIDSYSKKKKEATDDNKRNFYFSTEIALFGIQRYLLNYAALAKKKIDALGANTKQLASLQSMTTLYNNLLHVAKHPPTDLAQALQLALTIYVSLQVTGEPVSIGRLDYTLRKFCPASADDEHAQDLVDTYFLKVGEKILFNRNFFDNNQYWGSIAMGGGGSAPYPQGPSFSQWGQQLTLGGTDPETGKASYNNLTIIFLRAARRIPVNCPCLGLRVRPDIPLIYLEEAAKSILSGGAQPILLNEEKVVKGLRASGNYAAVGSPFEKQWNLTLGQEDHVPFEKWNSTVSERDSYDYTSDGCHEFLVVGKTWFCISGGPLLMPLELALNEGHDLLNSGPQFIHGMRKHYTFTPISKIQTYEDLEQTYFDIFKSIYAQGANGHLGGYGNITAVCPATLLNAFTIGNRERGTDFYSNGAQYNIFAPQYTGLSNFINCMWNIRELVFRKKMITLEELREILINNWGKTLVEPFIPTYLPEVAKKDFLKKCERVRQFVINEPKFGIDQEISAFGLDLIRRVNSMVVKMFSEPIPQFMGTLKRLANSNTSPTNPTFGIQIMPGGATFENYEDTGRGLGASFDGRLKGETIAQDSSPQNYLMDGPPKDEVFLFSDILQNYGDDGFWSGSMLDFNLDEDYPLDLLVENLRMFADGKGPNGITITVCDKANMERVKEDTEYDLLRFRMGGWAEYAVAMFPNLFDQHVRRIRCGPKRVTV